jgi:hypothetical protein
VLLLFARPWQIPPKWLKDQYQLAQIPNFMEATLESLRSAVNMAGQREVFLDHLPRLRMPTLIVWGIEDRVIPYWHATAAVTASNRGTSTSSRTVATCPTSSNPSGSYRPSESSLAINLAKDKQTPLFTQLPRGWLAGNSLKEPVNE